MQRFAKFKKILRRGFRATLNSRKSPSSFSSYKRLKLKLKVFLAGHIVAMVTYCAIKLTATCSPMIGQIFDTMILVSTDIEWL